LFFSVLLNLERFAISKLIGVLLAVLGTALTTFQDAQNDTEDMLRYSTKDTLLGDVFSLLAAVGYAAYSVQARLLCPENEELYSMTLLLGYVGLLTCIPLLPMAAYYMSDMELNFGMFKILILKGLLDFVITDYLLLKAVVLTNATIATVGLGLTIPMAFAADFFFQKADFTAMQYLGAFAVLLGFVLVKIMHTTELQCETNDTTVDDNVESGQDKPTESADPVIQTISSISATSEYPKV
jgi:solute carrier family 35 protein F5